MDPSEVRKRIVGEHEQLRAHLEILEESAKVVREYGAAVRKLTEKSQELLKDLRGHIDLEDAILVPAIREADAWGESRAQELTDHHAKQREQLTSAIDDVAAGRMAPPELAAQMLDLVAYLRRDMEHEEETYLKEDLLRDDVITIDNEAG